MRAFGGLMRMGKTTLFCLVLACTVISCAQQYDSDLASASAKVDELARQRRFTEAISVAESALRAFDQRNPTVDDARRIALIDSLANVQLLDNKTAAAADLLQGTLHDLEQRNPSTLVVADIQL